MAVSTPQVFLDAHGLVRVDPQPILGPPPSVAALVDHVAERFGDAPALAERRARLSFVELREAVDRAADALAAAGVGGANVYPAEVVRIIEADPQIAEVAVVARDHPRLGQEVVALVLPAIGVAASQLDRGCLVDTCLAELARYKVPVEWFAVEQFPRNAMSKVVKPVLTAWLNGDTWPSDLPVPTLLE